MVEEVNVSKEEKQDLGENIILIYSIIFTFPKKGEWQYKTL